MTPDIDQPARKSNVEVREETETRAASNQKFERAPELRIDAGEASQRLRLIVEERPRRDVALRKLIQIGARLH